ncbi:MAG: class II aldolase/adducin family protein [Rhodospirillales bacterium]|nr:class II aldolase/adducin family protein [Rhodospirillales bacterium]
MPADARAAAIVPPPHLAGLDPALLADLVDANRILFRQGVVDAFGHISVRHPLRPAHFLLARNLAPGLATAADIEEFDAESEPVRADAPRPYLERFIHGEIYRARPDVISVVHSHAASVIPFGLVPTRRLRAVYHMAGFLGTGVNVFEIRCCSGHATDLLIRSRAQGAALAAALGGQSVVLMRGHGCTVAASDIRLAVFRAVYTKANAELQAQALALGAPVYLTAEECEAAARNVGGQIARPWELWRRDAWS